MGQEALKVYMYIIEWLFVGQLIQLIYSFPLLQNTSPLWEDFVAKAGKLHTCLRWVYIGYTICFSILEYIFSDFNEISTAAK